VHSQVFGRAARVRDCIFAPLRYSYLRFLAPTTRISRPKPDFLIAEEDKRSAETVLLSFLRLLFDWLQLCLIIKKGNSELTVTTRPGKTTVCS